jgi:excisionase family DNA binding protein
MAKRKSPGRKAKMADDRADAGKTAKAEKVQPSLPEIGKYITRSEAAQILHVDPKTVRARIRAGELEAYRHGRRILISLASVERLIKRGRI